MATLDLAGIITRICTDLKTRFAALSHEHAAGDITSGTLDASRIPSLDASKIGSGTFYSARIPSLSASKIDSGTFDAARIPSLPASKIGSGTLDAARIPTATTSAIGGVKVDGSTITISNGVISAAGGGGGGGWTDVTSDFGNMVGWGNLGDDFAILSDGKSVIISGSIATEAEVAEIPSDYEPFALTFIGQCTNLNGNVASAPYVEGFGQGISSLYTGNGTEGEFFTVTYPLLSAVN